MPSPTAGYAELIRFVEFSVILNYIKSTKLFINPRVNGRNQYYTFRLLIIRELDFDIRTFVKVTFRLVFKVISNENRSTMKPLLKVFQLTKALFHSLLV